MKNHAQRCKDNHNEIKMYRLGLSVVTFLSIAIPAALAQTDQSGLPPPVPNTRPLPTLPAKPPPAAAPFPDVAAFGQNLASKGIS